MSFCLPEFAANELLGKIKSGEITPDTLVDMGSAGRRAYFEKFLGTENARKTNALFEKHLLLKNQQRAMIAWAEKATGIKPEVKRNLVKKIENLQEALDVADETAFLQDLVEQRLGVNVTYQEAGKIVELFNDVQAKEAEMKIGPRRELGGKATEKELEYGAAYEAFNQYIGQLKLKDVGFNEQIKDPAKFLREKAGIFKSIASSLDNSFWLRQGMKALTNVRTAKIWAKNFMQSFMDISKSLKGEDVMGGVNAWIYSHPLYDQMVKAKLSIGRPEEAFPTSPPEKIPGIGRLFKASQNAYEAGAKRMRVDIFEKFYQVAKDQGVDVSDVKVLESIANLTNHMTGRANMGKFESVADTLNVAFFSPRYEVSKVRFITDMFDPTGTPFSRKVAAQNVLQYVVGISAVMAIAESLYPGSVQKDPKATDFGKIKINNTRFTISDTAPLVVLATRLLTGESMSSRGKITKIGTNEFASKGPGDLITDYLGNKTAPVWNVINDIYSYRSGAKENKYGQPLTPKDIAVRAVSPLPIQDYQELVNNPNSADTILSMIASAFGIGINTY